MVKDPPWSGGEFSRGASIVQTHGGGSISRSKQRYPFFPSWFLCPWTECEEPPFNDLEKAMAHLSSSHGLVIHGWTNILPILAEYINHLALKRETTPSGGLPAASLCEDKIQIKRQLYNAKLREMLDIQSVERATQSHIPHACLFCKTTHPDRAALFHHLSSVHDFFIGHQDNLVNVNHFLDVLRERLSGNECLYCGRTFDSRVILQKHMRKFKHFRINANDKSYDPFYISNYCYDQERDAALPIGMPMTLEDLGDYYSSSRSVTSKGSYSVHDDRGSGRPVALDDLDGEEEETWDDWDEENHAAQPTMCLFDTEMFDSVEEAMLHMKERHAFDLLKHVQERRLSFYPCIRLINFIRRSMALNSCHVCQVSFVEWGELEEHLQTSGHESCIPDVDSVIWTDAKFLFPCIEGDPLLIYPLSLLENEDDDVLRDIRGELCDLPSSLAHVLLR